MRKNTKSVIIKLYAAVERLEAAADKNDVSACVRMTEFYENKDEGKKFYRYTDYAHKE